MNTCRSYKHLIQTGNYFRYVRIAVMYVTAILTYHGGTVTSHS